MKYKDYDDRVFSAKDAAGIVTKMRQRSLITADSDDEWMEGAAKRASLITGVEVSSSSPEAFLADLEKAGLIKRLDS